jgi:hypothetical protein
MRLYAATLLMVIVTYFTRELFKEQPKSQTLDDIRFNMMDGYFSITDQMILKSNSDKKQTTLA